MQHVGTVEEQVQQQQRAEKVEVGVARERQRERTVFADLAELMKNFADKIRAEFLLRVGRRNARDAEAGRQANERQHDQDDAGPRMMAAQMFRHQRRRDRAEDDGHERAEFEQAVAP